MAIIFQILAKIQKIMAKILNDRMKTEWQQTCNWTSIKAVLLDNSNDKMKDIGHFLTKSGHFNFETKINDCV